MNDVETSANVPLIINIGGPPLSARSAAKEPRFFHGGQDQHTGLVEVAMGTPLRTFVEDIGGGIPGARKFKAVQAGGPSGGLPSEAAHRFPVDLERFKETGSMMGSGGMIVLDEATCMVDEARYFLNFFVEESCGKCIPCRVRGQAHA